MNDHKILKRLCSLAGDLCDASNEEGYNSAAYKAVLVKISKISARIDRNQRRKEWFKEWFSHCVIFVLVIVLMWLILSVSC